MPSGLGGWGALVLSLLFIDVADSRMKGHHHKQEGLNHVTMSLTSLLALVGFAPEYVSPILCLLSVSIASLICLNWSLAHT